MNLRPLLLQELREKANHSGTINQADYLLTLGACDVAGYDFGDIPLKNFFEVSASLGNKYAKLCAVVYYIFDLRPLTIDTITRCEWATTALLMFTPQRVTDFFNTIRDCSIERTLEYVVLKTFELQVCVQKDTAKSRIANFTTRRVDSITTSATRGLYIVVV